jgi:hypothetical protein
LIAIKPQAAVTAILTASAARIYGIDPPRNYSARRTGTLTKLRMGGR